jgi:hypothetical protein
MKLVEQATLRTIDGQHKPVYVVNLPGRPRPFVILKDDVEKAHS